MRTRNNEINRIVIKDWGIENINEVVAMSLSQSRTEFLLELDDYSNYEIFSKFICALEKHNIDFQTHGFLIDCHNKNFSTQEWQNIEKFNEFLQKNQKTIEFSEFSTIWSFNEVKNANNKIDSTINNIKKSNLSPLEQFIQAYRVVSSKKYTESPANLFESRSLYGVLNSDKIVCVGYANWLTAIVNGLQDQNLHCENHSSIIGGSEGHCSNMVYIKDEKYHIDGLYYVDACFGSLANETDNLDFTYCLIPIEDLKNLKLTKFEPKEDNMFHAFLSNNALSNQILSFYAKLQSKKLANIPQLEMDKYRKEFAENLLNLSQNSIINGNKKTEDIINQVCEIIPYDTMVPDELLVELLDLFSLRANNRISKQDFDKELKAFATKIQPTEHSTPLFKHLAPWKNSILASRQSSYLVLANNLEITNGTFESGKMEYRFLQYLATITKTKSKPIPAEAFAKAYLNVLLNDKVEEQTARTLVKQTLDKTLSHTRDSFVLPLCKGDFAKRSLKLYTKREAYIKQLKESARRRREKQKAKKQNTQDQNSSNQGGQDNLN